ncbi:MAG: Uma2 family endonuclease [Coleofasciculus sp. Co-bin14]|nr:Uma2 family endonuclease [Coleofasciculus sp. Co-bin14]
MVVSSVAPVALNESECLSTEVVNLPEQMECIDGKLIEKTGITFKHSVTQANLTYYWVNYIISSGQRGKVCTEAPCRTGKQSRRPDVAYITPQLLEEIGEFTILPHSFPLIAEVASPDESAEELFAKAKEYLISGCQEVLLLFPENQVVLIITQEKWLVFKAGEQVSTQNVLEGFSVNVDELFA